MNILKKISMKNNSIVENIRGYSYLILAIYYTIVIFLLLTDFIILETKNIVVFIGFILPYISVFLISVFNR